MNIGKSTQIYLAKQERTKAELKAFLNISRPTFSKILNTKKGGLAYLPDVCEFFNIKASEFIEAGEYK